MAEHRFVAQAELDLAGETRRQVLVFVIWLGCLGAAVTVAALRRPTGGADLSGFTAERLAIAGTLGLVLPALLTWWVTHRRRRGGPHPRGITVDVTADGELRVWGRGYGQRLVLDGASHREQLVDMYSGRLGAWRQRRLTVVAARPTPGMPSELSLACVATDEDAALDLRLVGGEGDCLELARTDYLRLRDLVTAS